MEIFFSSFFNLNECEGESGSKSSDNPSPGSNCEEAQININQSVLHNNSSANVGAQPDLQHANNLTNSSVDAVINIGRLHTNNAAALPSQYVTAALAGGAGGYLATSTVTSEESEEYKQY